MNRLSKGMRLGIAGTAVATIGVASLVFAAWTTTGSGSGYAEAGSAQALTTVDVSANTTATLYPGVTGDVRIKISNPNTYPVRVTDVTLSGSASGITADGSHAGCTTTGVDFTNQTGLTIDVAASGSTETTLTGAASMDNTSQNACQGAKFTIPVTLAGNSNAA